MWKISDFKLRSARGKPVMGLEEAQLYLIEYNLSCIMEISEVTSKGEGVCFFVNDYLLGYKVLPDNFVPSSTVIPHRVKPRPGLETGWVSNLKEYDFIYRNGHAGQKRPRRLKSLEELVEYLNTHYAGEKV